MELSRFYHSTTEREGFEPSVQVLVPVQGFTNHKCVLNRYENLLLYSSFQRVTNQSLFRGYCLDVSNCLRRRSLVQHVGRGGGHFYLPLEPRIRSQQAVPVPRTR